jgi:hypothetical protein
MAVIQFFRETLTLDAHLTDPRQTEGFRPQHGDTLVFGARECTIHSLPSDYDYVIAADRLTLPSGSITLQDPLHRLCGITVLAGVIDGPFNVMSKGTNGESGEPGEPGEPGDIEIVNGKPHMTPGGDGGSGGPGSDGDPGGVIRIHYSDASVPPTASAPGGDGGPGGPGGAGGGGKPPGRAGKPGPQGKAGPAGVVEIVQVDPSELWKSMPFTPTPVPAPIIPSPRERWAAYRTDVGHYYFRRFDPASQIAALAEFNAAIVIDPANADAKTLRLRVIQQQTPTGVSRDLDMSPVYKELSANLTAAAVLVQEAFGAVQVHVSMEENARATRDQLGIVAHQLRNRAVEALDNVNLARGDAAIAKAEDEILARQLTDIQKKIDEAKDDPFNFFDVLTRVATVSGTIVQVGSAFGAIVSIPSGIKAFGFLVGSTDDGNTSISMEGLLKLLKSKEYKENLEQIGDGITTLIKAGGTVKNGLANFSKIVDELLTASNSPDQSVIGELLKEQAEVMRKKLITDLRQKQAQDRVAAAQRQAQNYAEEAQHAQNLHLNWSETEAFLNAGIAVLIGSARHLADIVAEEVFLARRALEIYQLEDASDVRFDYGYIHPDLDSTLPSLQRVVACLQSASELPANILTWNDIFLKLNAAQTGGFDVVHPVVGVSITDAAALAQLRAGGGLQFTIPASATPPSLFELKANSLTIELEGASASSPVILWIEHSGNWQMVRRPNLSEPGQPAIADFTLFPHSEAFNLNAGQGRLNAAIPATPQSSSEPGPPFSFWGRGVIADWRLFPEPSSTGLDLSQLTAIRLSINCIGLAAQGSAAPSAPALEPHVTLLPSGAPSAALARAAA